MATMDAEAQRQYAALREQCGFNLLSARSQIDVRGSDRATLLHNLCTNDVKKLQHGEGCEAVFTNVQGKVVGFGFIFVSSDSIQLDFPAGQSDAMLAHIDKYVITEDVELTDLSTTRREILVAGPSAGEVVSRFVEPPLGDYSHVEQQDISVRRVPWLSQSCYWFSVAADKVDQVLESLRSSGAVECCEEIVECCRVENGMPEFGVDISEENLPQEIDRVTASISFTKGCYLGQETVARIDALGHVNWLLRGLRFDGSDIPSTNGELSVDGKVVARLRSTIFSPHLAAPLALAYVKRDWESPGTQFETEWGTATVVELPLQ